MRFDTSSLLFVWHKYLRAAKSHGKNRGPISPVRSGSDRIGSDRKSGSSICSPGLKLRVAAGRKLPSPVAVPMFR